MYSVRHRPSGWARAWVTSDGCLSIMSDWGNYAYWWDRRHPTDRNTDHRDFLCHAGAEYIMGKLAGGAQEIDHDRTVEGIKDRIVRRRRERHLTRDQARDEWALVESTYFDDEGDKWDWYHRTKLEDAWDVLCYQTPRQLQMFMKNCWPGLVEAMRADLQPAAQQGASP